jgi:hypothetical protein
MFSLATEPLNLRKDAGALIADIEAQLLVPPRVVFIDTLNRSLVGSESKDEDMAAYLAAAAKIEQFFNCLVVLVHHCGIDGTRPRGHTSLTAAVDVQLAVERRADREIVVRVELAKDMAEGTEIFSRLEMVEVGADPDGDPITSFVVLPAERGGGDRGAINAEPRDHASAYSGRRARRPYDRDVERPSAPDRHWYQASRHSVRPPRKLEDEEGCPSRWGAMDCDGIYTD